MSKYTSDTFLNFTNIILVFCFITFLCLPLAGQYFHLETYGIIPKVELIEKREMKRFPQFSLAGIGNATYQKKFEGYYNDNLGFRSILIKLYNLVHILWLDTSPVSKVILGKKGWLFHKMETCSLSNEHLSRIKQRLHEAKDFLKKRNILLFTFLCPDQQTIYPEFLPSNIIKRKKTRLDQVLEYINKSNSGIDILDFRPYFYKAKYSVLPKNLKTLYYKTDFHWNEYGGFIAYQEIIKKLSPFFSGMPEAKLEKDFRWIVKSREKGDRGCNEELLSLYLFSPPVRVWSVPLFKAISEEIDLTDTNLPYVDKSILGKNSASYRVKESGKQALPCAVMVVDSFGTALTHFLGEHFRRIVFLHWSQIKKLRETIEYEKPNVVIYEVWEAGLSHLEYPLIPENS